MRVCVCASERVSICHEIMGNIHVCDVFPVYTCACDMLLLEICLFIYLYSAVYAIYISVCESMCVCVCNDYKYVHTCKYTFTFQPVFHDWYNKGFGMYHPVWGMVNIKNNLTTNRKE